MAKQSARDWHEAIYGPPNPKVGDVHTFRVTQLRPSDGIIYLDPFEDAEHSLETVDQKRVWDGAKWVRQENGSKT